MTRCDAAPAVADAEKETAVAPVAEALTVCAPGTVPHRHEALASPFASVVAETGVTVPFEPVALKSTDAPITGAPSPSSSRTVSDCGRVLATTPDCPVPERITSDDAPGSRAVAVNVADVAPATAAATVCTPAEPPSRHVVLASPLALVTTEGLCTEPPPAVTVKVTVAPATTPPAASSTRATSGCVSIPPAIADCPLPDAATTCDAGRAIAVALKLTGGRSPNVARTRCRPGAGPTSRKMRASPDALVTDVGADSVPFPSTTDHATVCPPTASPSSSRTSTTKGLVSVFPIVAHWPLPPAIWMTAGVGVSVGPAPPPQTASTNGSSRGADRRARRSKRIGGGGVRRRGFAEGGAGAGCRAMPDPGRGRSI